MLYRWFLYFFNSFRTGHSEKAIDAIITKLYQAIDLNAAYGDIIKLNFGYGLSVNTGLISKSEFDSLYLLSNDPLDSLHRFMGKIPDPVIGFMAVNTLLRIVIPWIRTVDEGGYLSVQKMHYSMDSLIFVLKSKETGYRIIEFHITSV